jgi:hypothetical protein
MVLDVIERNRARAAQLWVGEFQKKARYYLETGKPWPVEQDELTPDEKLLKAIFGEKD